MRPMFSPMTKCTWSTKTAQALSLFLALLLCLTTITGCQLLPKHGKIDHVRLSMDASNIFSEQDIRDAMNIVTAHFREHFGGCTLTDLTYDEAFSAKHSAERATQYQADQAIILKSSFDVDYTGGDGSLNPNSTYTEWQWILTRNSGGAWELQTWGYG